MAGRRKLLDLKNICLNSIYIHTVRYWNLINITKENKKLNFLSPKYKVGSCEYLSDDYVYFLLKKLYKYYKLNSAILLGFLHRNLRTIDFSFITSRNAVNSDVCQFIRNSCDVSVQSFGYFVLVEIGYGQKNYLFLQINGYKRKNS
jgi:hypothetical protein